MITKAYIEKIEYEIFNIDKKGRTEKEEKNTERENHEAPTINKHI